VIRIGATLYNMSPNDAKADGVKESDRHLYVRLDVAKNNLGLRDGKPVWFRRTSALVGSMVLRRIYAFAYSNRKHRNQLCWSVFIWRS
jgi:hypothetical protein